MFNEILIFALFFLSIFLYFKWMIKQFHSGRKSSQYYDKKVILVTGAAHGVGKALATKFVISEVSNIVVLVDINLAGLNQTALELNALTNNSRILTFQCDVSNPTQVKETIDRAKKAIGSDKTIDIVINNAGIVNGKPLLELTSEDITRTFGINTLSHFWMNKAVLPDMIERNDGYIVTVSSVMSTLGSAGLTDYCASKWAINGFHESLRLELRKLQKTGIKTLLVCPYAINTGMFDGLMENNKIVRMLMPILEIDEVVNEIFKAIAREDDILIGCAAGPRSYLYPWIALVFHSLPPKIMDLILSKLGACDGMDSFKGHNAKKTD